MKVFVTGAQGFVGRRLVDALRAKDVDVHAIDILPGNGLNYHAADIRSKSIVDLIPQDADALIHLAGLTRTPDCQNNAYACFDANVMATLNLIEAAQAKKVKQFIFASSEWVYGEWQDSQLIKDEDYPLDAHALSSEYAFSKLVSEVNLKQKSLYNFCPVTVLRFGIIYGPREKPGSAVESLFHAVKTMPQVQVGSLKTGRCFIHVDDIVRGIIASLGLGGFNIINLAGDKLITLGDIIETSKQILDKNPQVVESSSENFNLRCIANAKAKNLLGFSPRLGLKEGLITLMASAERSH